MRDERRTNSVRGPINDRANRLVTAEPTPRLTWSLALLAILTFETAAGDGERTITQILSFITIELFVVMLVGVLIRKIVPLGATRESRLTAIVGLIIAAFAVELIGRGISNRMLPLEQLLLILIRNSVLVLLLFAKRQDCQRAVCSLSLFLLIFTSTLSSHRWLLGSFALFAVVGIVWLSDLHRQTLQGRLIASSKSNHLQSPIRWALLLLLPLGFLFALPVAGISTRALPGFMPSSGGKDWYLESAQGGVGDGDAVVAGTENIQSFAAIEDAPFLNSHEPSLYDMFDDSYNEPVNVEKHERAISIQNTLSGQSSERELAESQTVGKEFSTVRKSGRPESKQVGDRTDDALFFVKGRVPLHLKVEAFDRFDGRDWAADENMGLNPSLQIEWSSERPWLRFPRPEEGAFFTRPETHALKITRLNSNRIPSPTQLLGVHIDKLDQADFYRWAQPGILQMDRDRLPSLTVIHLQSRIVDVRNLQLVTLQPHGGLERYRKVTQGASAARIEQLARRWTESVPPGWAQVNSIIEHLRQDFVHDCDARPAIDCTDSCDDFLFVAKRGPDYQFATAAVMLLRSLSYPARLVAGFYANPLHHDHRAQHTPVRASDIHVWAEVSTVGGTWIPIEPTPGYEVLRPLPTVWEKLVDAAYSFWGWISFHAVSVLATASIASIFFLQRKTLADRIELLIWSARSKRNARSEILLALRLMERHARRWGAQRPPSISRSTWLRSLSVARPQDEQQILIHFEQLADWAQFAPEQTPQVRLNVAVVCQRSVEMCWRLPPSNLSSNEMPGPERRKLTSAANTISVTRKREMETS